MDTPTSRPDNAPATLSNGAIQAQTVPSQDAHLQDSSTQTSPPGNEIDILQRIMNAVQIFDWRLIEQEILKLGPESYKDLVDMAPNKAFEALGGNILHYAVVEVPLGLAGDIQLETTRHKIVEACIRNIPEEIKREILNKHDIYGRTPLHLVASTNSYELLEYLLDQGACLCAVDSNGQAPLHYAATYLRDRTTRALLERMSPRGIRMPYDNNLRTPLDCAQAAKAPGQASRIPSFNEREAQTTISLLQKYKQGSPGFECSDIFHKQEASNAFSSNVHVLKRFTKFATWMTYNKPVGEVLHGTAPWMGELCRRQTANQTVKGNPEDGARQDSDPKYLTSWIHLPANNVREPRLDLRLSNIDDSAYSC